MTELKYLKDIARSLDGIYLVNANKLALKYPEVNDMPCIYADLPNGLDGKHYTLESSRKGHWIDYRDDGFVECPFCEHATNCEDDIDELHYCFYCGAELSADMRGDTDANS